MVIVFSDYECPACKALAGRLKSLELRPDLKFVVQFRHYPLSHHSFARPAAIASECAREQGRWAAMHTALYGSQDRFGEVSWGQYAAQADVPDSARFSACVLGDATAEGVVVRDSIAGSRLRIRGTPTLLIDDRLVLGAPTEKALHDLLHQAKVARESVTGRPRQPFADRW